MKQDKDISLTFVWWNTSLAPSAKTRSSLDDQKSAISVIQYLIEFCGADFIALGEMSEEDTEYMQSALSIESFEFKIGVSKVGRSKFDTLYIYNSSRIYISDVTNISSQRGGDVLKIAQKVTLVIDGYESPFYIFVSHWSSRLWCQEGSPDRDLLGVRLRDKVDEVLENDRYTPYIILLGDYNDEPFSDSLSHQVMASRDIDLVSKKSHLLYNPFWKCLGAENEVPGGSYFYKSGKVTNWHTFDQIIFSHEFIAGEDWRFTNFHDHVVNIPGYMEKIKDKSSIFDHFPVSGRIERIS